VLATYWIKGLDFGLEYHESEELGMTIILSLGILRIFWYKDVIGIE
jgi:hypothetical protein